MHGLVNRSVQSFISDNHGTDVWTGICRDAGIGFDQFEPMLTYESEIIESVLGAACARLKRNRAGLLEDIGTYLVTRPDLDAVRRLLRFGGETFGEFLHSLDDLRDRATLALPGLDFPELELREHTHGNYTLIYRWEQRGFGALALGILRAMADDYGALVFLDHTPGRDDTGDVDQVSIRLLDSDFAQAREFTLGQGR